MKRIAIIAVAYNRVNSLKRLLTSLEKAKYDDETTLIISIDKSKTDEVEKFSEAYSWPHGEKRVAKHAENLGLRRHMLSLGKYFDEFDALVILEDDVTVALSFMNYVKACVEKYTSDMRIAGISLYSFNLNYQTFKPFIASKADSDVYLMQCAQSWGEVWLKNQWLDFKDWYDKADENFDSSCLPSAICNWPKSSWLKYHTRYCIEKDRFFVYPYYAVSTNNGDAGVNFKFNDTQFQSTLMTFNKKNFILPDVDDITVRYDGFMEPLFLNKALEIKQDEFTSNLYDLVPQDIWKRYVLSTRPLPYQVVESFALELRPIEANVLMKNNGQGIWLYDTSKRATPPADIDSYQRYYYLYGKAFYNSLFMMGPWRCLKLIISLLSYKVKSLISSF